MKKIVFIIFIFISCQLFSQTNTNIINIFSFYNSDNIFLKVTVINQDTDRTLIIEINNDSKKRIYLDTTFIDPFTWKDSIRGPVIGIGFSHLDQEKVNECKMTVFAINPSEEIQFKVHITKDAFTSNFDQVKYYSFEIKYLTEDKLEKDLIEEDSFKIPLYAYYVLSKRFVIGNCEMKNYLSY